MKRQLKYQKSAILAFLAAIAMLLTSFNTFALGLGEISVFSSLNQPLEAEITLNNVRPGEMDDLILGLASDEAFNRAGVERLFLLSKLKFKAFVKNDGTNVIRVSSTDIIREPFLNFLVNVEWPRGNLVREYTILLDPPSFSRAPSTVSAPISSDILPIEEAQLSEPTTSSGNLAPITRDIVEELPEPLIEPLPDEEPLFDEPKLLDEQELVDEAELPELPGLDSGDAELADAELQDFAELPEEDALPEDSSYLPDMETIFDQDEETLEQESLDLDIAVQDELPDIDLNFDDTLAYDEAKTQALVEQFGKEDEQQIVREPFPVAEISAPATDSGDVEVQRGDTLWEIASSVKSVDVGINQAMISILRANPDAFIDNNINSLKTGVVLRIPERNDMLAISSRDALLEAQQQNALWREYRQRLAGAPVVETEPADSVVVSDTSPEELIDDSVADSLIDEEFVEEEFAEQELEILAPGADDEGYDRASGLQEGELEGVVDENNLLIAKESIAAIQLEKADLQKRLDIKVDEQGKTEALLTAKNEQLALLQARLEEINNESEIMGTDTEETVPAGNELTPSEATPDLEQGAVQEPEELELEDALASQSPTVNLDNNEALIDENANLLSEQDELNSVIEESVEPTTAETQEPESTVDEVAEEAEPVVEQQEPAISMPVKAKPKYVYLYDSLPPPLNSIVGDMVSSYGSLGLSILALPVLLLLGLGYVVAKRLRSPSSELPVTVEGGESEPEPDLEDFESTVVIKQEVVESKPSLLDKIKSFFENRKKKQEEFIDDTQETDDYDESLEDDDVTGEYEGELPETTGAFDPAIDEAAAAIEESYAEEDLSDRTSQFLAIDTSSEEFAAAEPESDDTTAEADVYLAYGLFDQAEDLLKEALASNADKPEYNAKLLETYFASGKSEEFETLAKSFKETKAQESPVLWTKVVAMGQELLPGNPLFAGESSGLKAADFVPSKPVSADIDVGDAESESSPDFDIGEATSSGADIDISQPMEAAAETIDDFDETIITPAEHEANDTGMDLSAEVESDSEDLGLDIDIAEADSGDGAELDGDIEALLDAELSETLSGMEDSDEDDTDLDFDLNADGEADLDIGSDLNVELDNDSGEGIDIDIGSDSGLDLDGELDISADLEGGADDLLNMVEDSGEDITTLDNDEELDADSTNLDHDDFGEETLISDDLTEIDFGESESIEGIESTDDTTGLLDIDSDIADIAVDDEVETKLDLAKAYIDMGDNEGAKSSLEEVMEEGTDAQKQEAENLLQKIA